MSLEEALKENTAAVLRLTDALNAKAQTSPAPAGDKKAPAKAAATADASGAEFDECKKLVTDLVKNGKRNEALAAIQEVQPKAKKLTEVDAAKLPALKAKLVALSEEADSLA